PDDLELALETIRHASHRVGDESPRQTMKSALWTAVILPDCNELLVLLFPLDSGRNQVSNTSLWSRNNNGVRFNIDLHFFRNRNGLFANSRHSFFLINAAEQFAAEALLPSLLSRHDAM